MIAGSFIKQDIFIKIVLILMAVSLWKPAFAQDPGLPDSVILVCDSVVSIDPDSGATFDIHINFFTDDSLTNMQLPLVWSGLFGDIRPLNVTWQKYLNRWERGIDSSSVNENRLLLFAKKIPGDSSDYLYTDCQRQNMITIRFAIKYPLCPQIIAVDFADSQNNKGLELATISDKFKPLYKGCRTTYGDPAEIGVIENMHCSTCGFKQGYPNPFGSQSPIEYYLTQEGVCDLAIYDVHCQKIRNLQHGHLPAGDYWVRLDGKDSSGNYMPSGIYFLRLTVNGLSAGKKLALYR